MFKLLLGHQYFAQLCSVMYFIKQVKKTTTSLFNILKPIVQLSPYSLDSLLRSF